MAKPRNVVMTPEAPTIELDDAGNPEPSLKEVEDMLAARDREEAATHVPAPLPPIDEANMSPLVEDALNAYRDEHIAPFAEAGLPHALDLADINSKIVVILEDNKPLAMLATPSGIDVLPEGDVAHKLPAGARIQKLARDRFEATQLGATVVQPLLVTATATEAIGMFIKHFHAPSE
jgi:hypothetical protein